MLICALCLSAGPSLGQSLGELSRQERARKQSQPPRTLHVYTNEDMTRPQILLPEDERRFHAAREIARPSLAQQDELLPALPQPAEIPLGDLARYLRLQKQLGPEQDVSNSPGLRVATPAPPPAGIPLGDVARYYRLQKQLRHRQLLSDLPGLNQPAVLAAPIAVEPSSVPFPAPVASPPKRSLRRTPPTANPSFALVAGVRVARGDSLWRIAKRHLGSGTKWRQLAELNPQLTNPHLIRVGEWIRFPLAASTSQVAKTVRVEKGDTLWKLASVELGSGLAWECIAEANPRIQNVNRIYPGQLLAIPTRCSAIP
jgi:hypothetical protein